MLDSLIRAVMILLSRHTGIELNDGRKVVLVNYIDKRLKELKLTPREYLHLLTNTEEIEFNNLINEVTINETFFFRHKEQFSFFAELLTDQIKRMPYKEIIIWSAGCSIGAEPYSIAIVVKELIDKFGANIKIIATDIDSAALEKAKLRIFTERSIKAEMPPEYHDRYFKKIDKYGNYELDEKIGKLVKFYRLNLQTDIYPIYMDYIFCRNVLYYFSNEQQRKIKQKLYETLKNNGYLFLSPTESMLGWSEYFREIKNDSGVKVYQKWTTDRRINDELKPVSMVLINQRRSLESYLMLHAELVDNDIIKIFGIISGKNRIISIDNDIFFNLGLIKAANKTYYDIDFNSVKWLSNEAIERLKDVINTAKKKGLKLRKIYCENSEIKEWLIISELNKLALHTEILDKIPNVNITLSETHLKSQSAPENKILITDEISSKKDSANIKNLQKQKSKEKFERKSNILYKTENIINLLDYQDEISLLKLYEKLIKLLKSSKKEINLEVIVEDELLLNEKILVIFKRFVNAARSENKKINFITKIEKLKKL